MLFFAQFLSVLVELSIARSKRENGQN